MAASTLGFEDYSLYSHMTDEELLQLAIDRSLNEPHQQQAIPPQENQSIRAHSTNQSQDAPTPRRHSISQNLPGTETTAHYSSPNPPNEKPPDP